LISSASARPARPASHSRHATASPSEHQLAIELVAARPRSAAAARRQRRPAARATPPIQRSMSSRCAGDRAR
jgi:hypothetical protein